MTHSFDGEYWRQVWQGDRAASMGSAEPNPHLISEVSALTPGTALDAGCGAGAEAIWLATRGWQVTGADIAAAALDRAAERAAASGVTGQVQWVLADLSTWQPEAHFDLVTTHYAHPAMAQLDFYDRIAQWVAPGGTLLIVGHLHPDADDATNPPEHPHTHERAHGPSRKPVPGDQHHQTHEHGGDGPPASASATAASITARLDPALWQVVTARESHRPLPSGEGHASGAGQVGNATTLHDVIVRATRRP